MRNVGEPKGHSLLFLIGELGGGGAEKVCCVLASKTAEKYPTAILYLSETDRPAYPLDPRVETIRLEYEDVPFRPNPFAWLAALLRNFARVRKIKRERKVDVSVSFLLTPNRLNVFSRQGERVVTAECNNPRIRQAEKFWMTRILYALSDRVVFQSTKVRDMYSARIRRRSTIVMNPISVACRADAVRKKRIVTAGRLTAQKNHPLLIRSFARFLKDHPDHTLTIYGEGEDRDKLEKLISDLGLEGKVFLPGNVADVHGKMRDAEMFVLSSDFEGLSNALLEAMSMGLACISTRCEGSTDVIRDGENGLLVDIGDGDGLTEKMRLLAGDPELRMRLEKQVLKDSEAFDKDRVIRDWEKVLFER